MQALCAGMGSKHQPNAYTLQPLHTSMSDTTAARPPPPRLADIWQAPHRPLFLVAGLWALGALFWWQWGWWWWPQIGLPQLGTPTLWHVHEMVFGFGGASVAAYFLTAVTSWTARPMLAGRPLMLLVAFWVCARGVMLYAQSLPLLLLLLPGALYFGLVTALLLRDIAAKGVWSKLGFPAAILALGVLDALLVAAACEGWALDVVALKRAAVMFFAMKVAVIAGGMIPAFTANWLRQTGSATALPLENHWANRLGLVTLYVALLLTLAGAEAASGWALIIAGLVQAWRMVGWRSLAVGGNMLLVMMHTTFCSLVAGLVVVGVSRLAPGFWPEADAAHALTMGAMSGMVLSVASRAAAQRVGGALHAGLLLRLAYALVWLGAWTRVCAHFLYGWLDNPVAISATLWCAGWLVFLAAFVPTLVGPVLRPVFSGTKAG